MRVDAPSSSVTRLCIEGEWHCGAHGGQTGTWSMVKREGSVGVPPSCPADSAGRGPSRGVSSGY